MKEITIKLIDKEYYQYVKKGQLEYHMRMKKAIEGEEYVKWMFMLGEYYKVGEKLNTTIFSTSRRYQHTKFRKG